MSKNKKDSGKNFKKEKEDTKEKKEKVKEQEKEEKDEELNKEIDKEKKLSNKEEKEKKENIRNEDQNQEEIQEEKKVILIPLETYIKTSIHLGTRAVTPTMREYVYKRKADGIAVLNTKKIDEKIAQGADFLAQFAPEDIIVCGRKEAALIPLQAFSKATGIKVFTKYPAGIMTNPSLKNFIEPKLVFVIDPWIDKNALYDAIKIKIPIMALCSTNNNTNYIDFVIPCNNKTQNSIGLVLYLLAKLYLEKRKIKKEIDPKEFYSIEEKEDKREQIDLTEAREFVKKKLAQIKLEKETKKPEKN